MKKITVRIVPTVPCIEYWMRRNQYELKVDGKVEGSINNVYLIGGDKKKQKISVFTLRKDGKMTPELFSRNETAEVLKLWRNLESNSK